MPPILSFIGWHNSGKTTLARQVVTLLKARGYAIGVVKSTKETGIHHDAPHNDSALYHLAGADIVALAAPDQLLLRTRPPQPDLLALTRTHFAAMDLVIAEGFKSANHLPKIEVRLDPDAPLLLTRVPGVIAVVTDQEIPDVTCFGLGQSVEIAAFIEANFLARTEPESQDPCLLVDGIELQGYPPVLKSRMEAFVDALRTELGSRNTKLPTELTIRFPPA